MYELDEIDIFFHQVIQFVEGYTNFKTYKRMEPEKKAKYIEKLCLLICFETSPRKRFDISKDTIRHVVRDILNAKAAEVPDDDGT